MSNATVAYIREHATPAEWQRLQRIARRIKSRQATPAEVAEYQLIIALAAEVAS